jgi:hypothetical protein
VNRENNRELSRFGPRPPDFHKRFQTVAQEFPCRVIGNFLSPNRELIAANRENNGNRIAEPSTEVIGREATTPLWRNPMRFHCDWQRGIA